jgi:alcohol dehydrogenase
VLNAISDLKSIIAKESCKRVFLVTGKGSYDGTIVKNLIEGILSEIVYFRHSDFDVNPNISDIKKGLEKLFSFNPDLIIAVGGGSVLDTAKLITAFTSSNQRIEDVIAGSAIEINRRKIPLVAIPTTAGSGSESTHFSVLYIDDKKFSIASNYLLPDYIILDTRLTYSMSPFLTGVTGMDALSQSIESVWAVGATSKSFEYSMLALDYILDVFPSIIKNPISEGREKMLIGSHLAGNAINISKTTAPHALSYFLTINYGIPHGLAVFLLLPEFYIVNTCFKGYTFAEGVNQNILKFRISTMNTLFKSKGYNNIPDFLRSIVLALGKSLRLRDYGVKKADIEKIAKSVNIERLSNNPFRLSEIEIIEILNIIF